MELQARIALAWFFLLHARRSALVALASGSTGSPFARGFRLEIARNAHFTRATVIDHIKFEYTGGGRIGDMLHITFSTLAHGGILPKDQRAHTQLAGESAKEENV